MRTLVGTPDPEPLPRPVAAGVSSSNATQVTVVVDHLSRFTSVGWYGVNGYSVSNPGVTGGSCPICDAEFGGEWDD